MERITLFKSYLEDFSRMKPEVMRIAGDGAYALYDSIDESYGFNEIMNWNESDAWILYLAAHEGGHSWTINRLMRFMPIYLIMGSMMVFLFLFMVESFASIIWLVVVLLTIIVESKTSMFNEMAAEKFVKKLLGPGFQLSMFLEATMKAYGSTIGDSVPKWRFNIMLNTLRELEMEYWRI
jgi:hypothetical protein